MTDIRIIVHTEPILIEQSPKEMLPKEGTILEGEIISKEANQAKVLIQDQEIMLTDIRELVESEGESASFIVTGRSETQITVEYMKPTRPIENRSISNGKNFKRTVEVAKDYEAILEKALQSLNIDEKVAIRKMTKDLEQDIELLTNKLTKQDLNFMVEEGLDPEKISIKTMANLVKSHKELVREHNVVELKREVTKEVKLIMDKYEPVEQVKKVVFELERADLPVTKKQVDHLMQMVKVVEAIREMPDEKALKVLELDSLPTIEKVYQQIHEPNIKPVTLNMSEDQVIEMVKQYLMKNDMPVTEENIEVGKALVERALPVTEPNIEFVKKPEITLSKIDTEDLIERMVQHLSRDLNTKDVVLEPLLDYVDIDQVVLTPIGLTEKVVIPPERRSELKEIIAQVKEIDPMVIYERVDSEEAINLERLLSKTKGEHKRNNAIDLIKEVITPKPIQELLPLKLGQRIELVEQEVKEQTLVKNVSQEIVTDIVKSLPDISREMGEDFPKIESYVKAHRMIEEIRLKMTIEAAVRLESSGLKIDIEPLERVVEGLRRDELKLSMTQTNQSVDIEGQVDSDVDITNLKDTLQSLKFAEIKSDDLVAKLIKSNQSLSLKKLEMVQKDEQLETVKVQVKDYILKNAKGSYEQAETRVRPDLGDKVEKTFKQIEPLLIELKMPVSDSNVKAVEILARNEMPISKENILDIQVAHEKIEFVIQKLKPMVAVKMIQSGINPIELEVDEIIEFIKAFEIELGETDIEKVGKLILDLFENNQLPKEQKDSIMGIYRTFDTVLRSKGSATGFIVKNELPLNMNQLFEAAKFIRKTKGVKPSISVDVDESFGKLEALVNSEKSIQEMVRVGLENVAKTQTPRVVKDVTSLVEENVPVTKVNLLAKELVDIRISNFVTELEGTKLESIVDGKLGVPYEDLPLESLTKLMKEWPQVAIPERNEQLKHEYLSFMKRSPKIIQHFVEHKIPLTMKNFTQAMAMNKEPFLMMNQLQALVDLIEEPRLKDHIVQEIRAKSEQIIKGEVSYKALSDVAEEVETIIRMQEAQDPQPLNRPINQIKGAVQHTQLIQVTEDYYQIPIFMNQKWSQLNMYVFNEKETSQLDLGDMKVLMRFETQNMGNIQALLNMKGNHTQVTIQTEYPEDQGIVKEFEDQIRSLFSESNYTLTGLAYDVIEQKEPIQIEKGTSKKPQSLKVNDGHIDWVV